MTENLELYGRVKTELRRADNELSTIATLVREAGNAELDEAIGEVRLALQTAYILAADNYDFWKSEVIAHMQEG